jgi:hypothetical protein
MAIAVSELAPDYPKDWSLSEATENPTRAEPTKWSTARRILRGVNRPRFRQLLREKPVEAVHNLRGALFQFDALHDIADRLADDFRITSSDSTLDFYQDVLFPGSGRRHYPLGLDSLDIVSVPDGMLLQEIGGRWVVGGIIECTLATDAKYFRRKQEFFSQYKERFPVFSPNATCIFVTPYYGGSRTLTLPVGTEHLATSFSLSNFEDRVDRVAEEDPQLKTAREIFWRDVKLFHLQPLAAQRRGSKRLAAA